MPACRNWQTRQTQNLLMAASCGFDPRRRHQITTNAERESKRKNAEIICQRFLHKDSIITMKRFRFVV